MRRPELRRRIVACVGIAAAALLLAHGPAGAAVITIAPDKGCVGTLVNVEGAGWLEPQPVCHYRFLFDHPNPGNFQEVAPREPDGLFGPPGPMSFAVPADSKPGPHKVRVQLFLNTGEFLQQEQQPFSVIGVEYRDTSTEARGSLTWCQQSSSGFDPTNVGKATGSLGADGPAWVSVARSQTTRAAKAHIRPAGDATAVQFKSTNKTRATVAPSKAASGDQVLRVTGVSVGGSPQVEAFTKSFNGDEALCKPMNVAVYRKKTVKVAAHKVQLKNAAGNCPKPAVSITAAQLQTRLNQIWDQAAVAFTVTMRNRFDANAILADDNGDCQADEDGTGACGAVIFGPELQKIHAAAKDATADVNVYFVKDYECPFASYHTGPKVIVGVGTEDQTGLPITVQTGFMTAHELGHHLQLPHCDGPTIDNTCGGEGGQDLMNSGARDVCAIHKPEWDTANAAAGP